MRITPIQPVRFIATRGEHRADTPSPDARHRRVRSFTELSPPTSNSPAARARTSASSPPPGCRFPRASSSVRRRTPRSATPAACASASRACSRRSTSTTPAALDRAAAEVRAMVETEPMPELARARRSATPTSELVGGDADVPVAVRSSATAEDTESASFAGMNETFLNVRGADAVVDAVRRCWSSLFGARTVFYRAKRGFGQADMDIAVVVQRQVQSTRAGVMFTIDPASAAHRPARHRGLLRPRRVRRLRQRLARPLRGPQGVPGDPGARRPPQGAGDRVARRRRHATRELGEEEARRPVLTDEEVRAIAELGRRIEDHYGSPQDTEWAIDAEGGIWMLQSRPVTSAGGKPRPSRRRAGGERSSAASAPRPGRQRAGAGRRALDDAAPARRGRRPRHPHDRARLGAADAQGGGDRDRLRRDDLPRGDRLARARHPLHRRHRQGDQKLRDGEIVTVDATQGVVREGAMTAPRSAAAAPAAAAAPPRRRPARSCSSTSPSPPRWSGRRPRRRGRRPAAGRADGHRGARGQAPAPAARGGRGEEFIERMGEALTAFADRVRPAADHLSDDRLPHERVPRARGRRPVRARGGEPDDRLPRRPALHDASPTCSGSSWRRSAASGTRGTRTST